MFTRVIYVLKNRKSSLAVSLVMMFFCVVQLNAAPIAPGDPDYSWAFDDGPGATTATRAIYNRIINNIPINSTVTLDADSRSVSGAVAM